MFQNRIFASVVAVFCILTMLAPDAQAAKRKHHSAHRGRAVSTAAGTNDARYADFVLNPTTGEVYHQQNADDKRYPASLTKMMTLYLLFEALEQRKTTLDARMDVSEYAATMPQTNLALSPGESIPVETAIKALVVRSANDVAVVVAEALGGNTSTFADMMTNKARQLGMRNTVFKNPNGLPNSGQYTTARDMAKLGIALKRDFPKYYPYFSTLQFSYDGVTYYTHNRVMLRYAGVDGIKTGFTGAAGFNLVTSAVRGGRPLVGVVLGGTSGGWRDNRMIQLLDQSYAVVASRGAAKGKANPANLPLSKGGTRKAVGLAPSALTDDVATVPRATLPDAPETEDGDASDVMPAATVPQDRESIRTAQMDGAAAITTAVAPSAFAPVETQPAAARAPAPASLAPTAAPVTAPVVKVAPTKPISRAPIVVTPRVVTPSRVQVTMVPSDATPTAVAQSPFAYAQPQAPASVTPSPQAAPTSAAAPVQLANPVKSDDNGWGIQVGAFSTHDLADQAARNAMQIAAVPLKSANISVVGPAASGAAVHRARLENLSQGQAKKACEALISNNSPCFIFKSNDVR